jgi:hypothetical protein
MIKLLKIVLSHVWVIIDGFWLDFRIYWTLTNPWLQAIITVPLIHTLYSSHTQVFSGCCVFYSLLVTASNGGHSPSSGFPNCSRSQLPATHSNSSKRLNPRSSLTNSVTHQPTNSTQLTHPSLTVLLIISRHGPHRKHRFLITVFVPLPSNCCLVVCFVVVA